MIERILGNFRDSTDGKAQLDGMRRLREVMLSKKDG